MTGTTQCCRSCGAVLKDVFVDLGMSPVSNHLVLPDKLLSYDPFFPLKTLVCGSCFLVQTIDVLDPDDHFHGDYVYFSSASAGWVEHARQFAEKLIAREKLGPKSLVVEVASNDGYLLQHFRTQGIPALGVDPAANCAAAAMKTYGVETEVAFFGRETAERLVARGKKADLTAANNVLAHVPDLNDFVSGFKTLLEPEGISSFEFPHLLRMIEGNQFDTIYHEHYSYLSLTALEPLFRRNGLRPFDVEEIPTHGGSLRLFVCHDASKRQDTPALQAVADRERAAGLNTMAAYTGFREKVLETKRSLLSLLIDLKRQGKRIAGYGAPAKGNTLLNFCGIGTDFIDYTVDRAESKQGRYLPGSRLPVYAPDYILNDKPDYVLILPWNIRDEVMAQMSAIRGWGGKFIVPIPRPEIV